MKPQMSWSMLFTFICVVIELPLHSFCFGGTRGNATHKKNDGLNTPQKDPRKQSDTPAKSNQSGQGQKTPSHPSPKPKQMPLQLDQQKQTPPRVQNPEPHPRRDAGEVRIGSSLKNVKPVPLMDLFKDKGQRPGLENPKQMTDGHKRQLFAESSDAAQRKDISQKVPGHTREPSTEGEREVRDRSSERQGRPSKGTEGIGEEKNYGDNNTDSREGILKSPHTRDQSSTNQTNTHTSPSRQEARSQDRVMPSTPPSPLDALIQRLPSGFPSSHSPPHQQSPMSGHLSHGNPPHPGTPSLSPPHPALIYTMSSPPVTTIMSTASNPGRIQIQPGPGASSPYHSSPSPLLPLPRMIPSMSPQSQMAPGRRPMVASTPKNQVQHHTNISSMGPGYGGHGALNLGAASATIQGLLGMRSLQADPQMNPLFPPHMLQGMAHPAVSMSHLQTDGMRMSAPNMPHMQPDQMRMSPSRGQTNGPHAQMGPSLYTSPHRKNTTIPNQPNMRQPDRAPSEMSHNLVESSPSRTVKGINEMSHGPFPSMVGIQQFGAPGQPVPLSQAVNTNFQGIQQPVRPPPGFTNVHPNLPSAQLFQNQMQNK